MPRRKKQIERENSFRSYAERNPHVKLDSKKLGEKINVAA